MNKLSNCYTLKNGTKIPCIGFGTYKALGQEAISSIKKAINCGYRHIDTASLYENEEAVGEAVRECGLPRDELFVTSKLWNTDQGYENTLKAFEKTMSKLKLDYLDLYLIHWPVPGGHENDYQALNLETWRAFEKLYKENRVKAIGVSNFKVDHLKALMSKAEVMPMVNQLEIHPCHLQSEVVDFCKANEIIVESWGPLLRGKAFQMPELKTISEKYNKTIAQVCIRWNLQKGLIPLPKSVNSYRIKENADVFDFNISNDDMAFIDSIGKGEPQSIFKGFPK